MEKAGCRLYVFNPDCELAIADGGAFLYASGEYCPHGGGFGVSPGLFGGGGGTGCWCPGRCLAVLTGSWVFRCVP